MGLLETLTNTWLRRLEAANKKREPWRRTAEICTNFYSGAVGFMWDSGFRAKYFSSLPTPRFKVTISKAFEMVALIGPSIYWDYAKRSMAKYKDSDVFPEAFGDPSLPEVMAIYNQVMLEQSIENGRIKTRNSLMEDYLNYAPKEQPHGGLIGASKRAVTDSLITGLGTLWTERYSFPGSDTLMTGSFYDTPMNLFIDPDSNKPDMSDATWIARRHEEPYWVVERRFGYKDGELKRRCKLGNTDGDDRTETNDSSRLHHVDGSTHDKIVWYEIFSKCGVGTRGKSVTMQQLHERFDEVVGDYAYVCITRGINHPLNLPDDMLTGDEAAVQAALQWPCPYYKDSGWPVSPLRYYENQSSPWPIAPLAPGLGELIFLNIMMSCLADRIYQDARPITGIAKSVADDVMAKINGPEFAITIELEEMVGKRIDEMISMLNRPEMNGSIFQMIDRVSLMFDKRVGLPEFMYGMNQGGKILRTAADVNAKQQATSIRPDYMGRCIDDWQTSVANNDMLCAAWFLRGQDQVKRIGPTRAQLWDALIADEDPEIIFRGMKCEIIANSTRRPNKDKDLDSLTRISQYLLPTLQANAAQTGDYTAFNSFVLTIGDTMDIDTREWLVPSAGPPQPPEPPVDQQENPGNQLEQGM